MAHKYPFLFFLFIFLFSQNLYSQHTVEGVVVDQNNSNVPYATVVLLQQKDSTAYKGTFSEEEGKFHFSEIEKGNYLVKVSFVGFQDLLKPIVVNENVFLKNLVLQESTADLDEVVIRAKNPSVTRAVDRLIFNVENTTLSSGNTWEILKKTPGVLIMEDNLRIRNNGVTVYLNDRKVQLSASELRELLENYSATNIKSVEVLTNPPAKYEAEGGAVLNIVTSKIIFPGYKGSVNTSYTQAVFPKYNFGTSHFFKNEKINFFANYSFNPRKEFKDDDSFINFKDYNSNDIAKWRTDFDRVTRSQAHQANVVLDYSLTEKDVLSICSDVLFSPNKTFNNTVNTAIYNGSNELDSTFVTKSELDNDQKNIAVNLGYKHNFENAAQFSVNTHYTNFSQSRFQHVSTNYFSPEGTLLNNNSFNTDAEQEINIYTAQADFTSSVGFANLETGVKASVIDSESGINFFNLENSGPEFVPGLSDNFLYDEEIFAGYLSLSKDWEKWSIKAGLRGEQTSRKGTSLSLGQTNDRSFFDLFPSFYLMHSISDSHSFTFDYGRRIARPRYESLNPFRYYLNENNFNAGNPDLRSSRSHNFNLNYTYKGSYFFDFYYRDNGPNATTLAFQDNEDYTLRTVYANVLESTSYGLDITHGRSITRSWYFYGYISAFYEEEVFLAVESDNEAVSNEAKGIFVQLYNHITLSKDGSFTGEASFVHWPTFIQGSYQVEPKTTVSFGLRKTLWNRSAEITLNLEDILNTTNSELISKYQNQDNGYFAKPETRYVRIGFKYNFGNFRLSDNNRAIEAAERERL